jgi:putative CRISPR-associated protein (TIGR02619 family)
MNTIVSPVGTSILTNAAEGNERKLAGTYANYAKDDVPAEDRAVLEALITKARQKMLATPDDARLSAEINTFMRFYEGRYTGSDTHYLVCTDTWLGKQTAGLVEEWLKLKGFAAVQIFAPGGLSTASLENFQSALSELVRWCEESLKPVRSPHNRVVFNLSGGFKSIQGFLQTLAQVYADESIYIFETGNELLHIPRLPVKIDACTSVKEHLKTFRRLALSLAVGADDVGNIPETFLLSIGGEYTLSSWGELVFAQCRDALYSAQLQASPSSKVRFSEGFEKSLQKISADRLAQVNQRIDDLARYAESGENLKRLDFKALKGKSMAPSTHECDAWADGDAQRIYAHYEEEVIVLDRLDKALH